MLFFFFLLFRGARLFFVVLSMPGLIIALNSWNMGKLIDPLLPAGFRRHVHVHDSLVHSYVIRIEDCSPEEVTLLYFSLVEASAALGKSHKQRAHLRFTAIEAENGAKAQYARQAAVPHEERRRCDNLNLPRIYHLNHLVSI